MWPYGGIYFVAVRLLRGGKCVWNDAVGASLGALALRGGKGPHGQAL